MSSKPDAGGLIALAIIGLIAAICGAVYEVTRKGGALVARAVGGKGGP